MTSLPKKVSHLISSKKVNTFSKFYFKIFLEIYIGFTDCETECSIRSLRTDRIGTLLKIRGQVVRTHPVHPELLFGVFTCNDCGAECPAIEQQFKYEQPQVCSNSNCGNRSRFTLDTHKSKFCDFQKVKIRI